MSTTITPHLVFVYGTLKSGFYNNRCIEGGKLIATGNTRNKYGMKHLGSFPGIDMSVEVSQIHGEVWEVSHDMLLHSLDMLEGYPSFYDRAIVSIETDTETVQAWMYFLANPKDYTNQYIADGVWKSEVYSQSDFIENPESKIKTFAW